MNRKLINWLGLLGILAFASYAAAVIFSPMAYPGYNWMEQAVSDLSAESAPSRHLWEGDCANSIPSRNLRKRVKPERYSPALR